MPITESPAAVTANANTLTQLTSDATIAGKRLTIEAMNENLQSDGTYGTVKLCGPSGTATRWGRTLKPGEWHEFESHQSPQDRVRPSDFYFITDLNGCGVRWLLEQ